MDNSILVSCVMPTRGRAHLAPLAVECFLSQTYPNKELLILDDGDEPSFPAGWQPPAGVKYSISDGTIRYNIPQKLNALCESAHGEIICRFDDDDWSSRDRIESQLQRLLESGRSVTGFHSMIFIDELGSMRKYRGELNYCLGSSMMFRRTYWASHRWNEKKIVGSDNAFGREAAIGGELISVDAGRFMYARVHASNTSPKEMHLYGEVRQDELPAVLCR